jgi:hypothetical protein
MRLFLPFQNNLRAVSKLQDQHLCHYQELGSEKIILLFPLFAAGAWYFGVPKYPKRLRQSNNVAFHYPSLIKKNIGTSFCVQFILNFEFSVIEHKTTAFQVW